MHAFQVAAHCLSTSHSLQFNSTSLLEIGFEECRILLARVLRNGAQCSRCRISF